MSDILESLLNDFISMAENNKAQSEGMWREEPVDLVTFFKSKEYLNEKPYDGVQTDILDAVGKILLFKISGDASVCPEDWHRVTEYVSLLGKGAGKDFLASGILAYVCYLLCCLRDPQGHFNFGQNENIDLINVAINAYQANNVFFKKLKARILNCKWFCKVTYNPGENENAHPNEFQITKNQIRFYKNITAHSAHSDADSFEGFNPLVVIFDEIGGFEPDKAQSCYDTLRSSATTRFNDKIFLLFISFPRSADDFMMKKYNEYLNDPKGEVLGIRAASWEVNPKIKREKLQKDYDTDPEGARMRYETIPPAYRDGLFQFPERIDECVVIGKQSQCHGIVVQEKITTRTLHNGMERHFIGLEIYNLVLDPQYTYYLGGDGGVTTDSYVLCLGHAEPVQIETVEESEIIIKTVNKPVEDLILEWRPSKKDKLPVDLMNVADVIEMICKQVFVKKALFDKFNSAEVVQRLMAYGVEAEDKNWSNPFQLQLYQNFKALIYTGQVALLDYQSRYSLDNSSILSPNEELKALKIINGNKVDHDPDKSKDFSDSRAAFSWLASTDDPADIKHYSMPTIRGAKRAKRR